MIHHTAQRVETALLLAASLGGASLACFCQSPDTTSETRPAASLRIPVSSGQEAAQSTTNQSTVTPEEEADALLGHQRYQEAIAAYQRAPQDKASVWNKMGVAYQLMFNSDDAARCYLMARKLDPKNATALNNLGSLAIMAKKYGAAEKLYKKAIKLDPHNALYNKNLGTAYLADKRYKQGWEAYRAALAIDPNIFMHLAGVRVENPSSVQERGALNFYMAKGCVLAGKPQQAIEYLRLALNEGFVTPKKIFEDNEFAGLRDLPAFQEMMAANLDHR
jgi:tetratricopeptide (TPR) repeat protein